ncbi:alpha family phenol-soluble modulin [Staphylococcus devriesei]|uniref:Alpha family phenol-soluble modulin n=1 Tax=Staphylococcus devriesei TaxID=586733 RepID=A0A2K4DTN3_9STAP|nr:alpha family phenol-soluble modulin [Staphylococcus caledonicus]MCE5090789.1 alpha family phenol-soluble modulin [Staphylococcus devriesei]MCE5097802.1 alpha family phenol-soluble modulin [Staphylococcus devriesei]PNZ90186.1 hypothetical protein CD147_01395 [Staphylococcus devriesei]PTE68144.1 alpha family phenol-soluble modulin [Staphylococcus devriesei]
MSIISGIIEIVKFIIDLATK